MPVLLTAPKLLEAIETDQERMQPHRDARIDAIRRVCGRYYYNADGSTCAERQPMNLMHRGVSVLTAYLAARDPQEDVVAKRPSRRGTASLLSTALSHWNREVNRVRFTRRWVFDALTGPRGIGKVGVRAGSEIATVQGQDYDRGRPYLLNVDLDDWGCDSAGRCPEEWLYEFHRYRIPREVALDSGIFEPHSRDVIARMARVGREDRTRVEGLSRRDEANETDLVDTIELYDVVIYDDGVTYRVDLPADGSAVDDYLRIRTYTGPGRGPFRHLEFFPVANQPHGLPWVAIAREQAEVVNNVLNKAVDEIMRARKILVGRKESGDDLDAIKDSKDSDVLSLDDPSSLVMFEMGTVVKELMPFAQMFTDLWNVGGGQIDILGGSGGRTDKATIYSGLHSSAMQMLADMQNTHDYAQNEISQSLGWIFLKDPLMVMPMTKRLAGGELIEVVYDQQAQEADPEEFEFRIRPRSMGPQDQNARAKRLIETMDLAMRSAQLTMATQGYWRSDRFLDAMGKLQDIDGMDDFIGDPAGAIEAERMMAHVPDSSPGTVAGRSGVNPAASYRARPVSSDRFTNPEQFVQSRAGGTAAEVSV